MIVDTSKPGLAALFQPYEVALLRRLWQLQAQDPPARAQGSGELWQWVCGYLREKGWEPHGAKRRDHPISRASVIFALNRFVDMGLVAFNTGTGKGGERRLYYVVATPNDVVQLVYREISELLAGGFSAAL